MGSTAECRKHVRHSIPTDILDDLCSRFIINLPREDRGNLVRICFQMEQAHWFYLDYYCTDETTRLNPCGIRDFAAHIFQHVPQLREHFSSLDEVLENWREYKQMVPTYGAILLDTELTHVLLVKSFWTKASWGFPKGKVNEDEEPWNCAAREVLEETGFDISQLINRDDYIETIIHEQIVRLYIIGYVPRDTKFQPRTRNEIKACEWFPLADLPANKKDMTPKVKMGVSPNAFFMVLPFVKRMRRWVAERNSHVFTNTARTRHKSMGDIESSTVKNKYKTISQGLQNEIQEYQQQNNYLPKQYKNHGNWQGNYGNNYVNNHSNYHGNNQGNGPGNGHSNYYGNSHNYNHGNNHWNNYGNGHNYNHGNSHSYNYGNSHSYNQGHSHNYNHGNNHNYNHNNSHWNNHNGGHYNNHGNGHIKNHNNGHTNSHNNGHWNNHGNNNWNNRDNNHANNHGYNHINNHSNSHNNSQWNNHGNIHSHDSNHQNQCSAAKMILNDTKKDSSIAKRQLFTPENTEENSIDTRQLFTPENTDTDNLSPVQKDSSPKNETDDENAFYNFVAPAWADFKFDKQAILDCFI